MRLFAAVFPPITVRQDLRATLDDLPAVAGLRLTRAENLHFTLAFFGERPAADVGPLGTALRRAAVVVPPFRARLEGISGFPASDRARVLFAGLSDGADRLSTLHDTLLDELGEDLRPAAQGPFRPHLTFCRPRGGLAHGQFAALQREARPWSWDFEVEALCLVQSETGPGGARYAVLAAAGLGV